MTEIWMPDIPRIYTAVAEWMSCMIFILATERRFSKWKTTLITGVILKIQIEFLTLTAAANLYFWLPCMIAAVVLMIGMIFVCSKVCWMDAVCYGTIAFIAAEFIASFEWQVGCFISQIRMPNALEARIMIFVFYNALAFFLYQILKKYIPKDGRMEITKRECVSIVLIAAVIFTASNFSYLSIATPFSSDYGFQIGNIRTLVDGGGIAILYAQLIQYSEMRVRRELEAVQGVLQNQYAQYMQSKESIELVNYKYHDLKHQIAYLRSEEDSAKREAFLSRMEEEIRQYDAQNKTGNKVLDTILTAKSFYCVRNGISMTCVADGTLLDFMDVMDVCSIFGNALDNAIECVMKIEEIEKRLIHVTVSKQKNFLLLRFENYCEHRPEYEKGSLITTKDDKEFHGYGLKSIRYTVNKYDGALNITTEGNWFDLKILIPLRVK